MPSGGAFGRVFKVESRGVQSKGMFSSSLRSGRRDGVLSSSSGNSAGCKENQTPCGGLATIVVSSMLAAGVGVQPRLVAFWWPQAQKFRSSGSELHVKTRSSFGAAARCGLLQQHGKVPRLQQQLTQSSDLIGLSTTELSTPVLAPLQTTSELPLQDSS